MYFLTEKAKILDMTAFVRCLDEHSETFSVSYMGNLSRLFFKIAITDTLRTLVALGVSAFFKNKQKRVCNMQTPFRLILFSCISFDTSMTAQLPKFDYVPMLWIPIAWLVYHKLRQLYLFA